MLQYTISLLFLRELAFILSGVALCWMAYRLFLVGVQEGGAEEVSIGTYLRVKGGGPGTVFALLGAGVLIYAIMHAGRMDSEMLELLIDADAEARLDEHHSELETPAPLADHPTDPPPAPTAPDRPPTGAAP
jgi:hypothetical protein